MQRNKHNTFINVLTNKVGTQDYFNLFRDISNEIGRVSQIIPNTIWEAPKEYKEEMGDDIKSEIWLLGNLSLSEIVQIKRWTMYFEYQYSINGQRQFNLNPGYFSLNGMFLLTHKDNNSRGRINLDDGVWQEKQYTIIGNRFLPNDNTFSEFLSNDRIVSLNSINPIEALTVPNIAASAAGRCNLQL